MRACLPRVFMVAFGLLFVIIGGGVGFSGWRSAVAEAERAERLLPQTAVQVDRAMAGSEVLVEGTISSRNRPVFRDFVAYVREEYRGTDNDGDSIWVVDEMVRPRLLVEAGGIVQIANEDYRIDQYHQSWRESDSAIYNSQTGGTKRYAGFVAGGAITLVGTIQAGPEGNEVLTEVAFGGTRAEYIAANRSDAFWLPIFGTIFVVVGLIIAGAGLLLGR